MKEFTTEYTFGNRTEVMKLKESLCDIATIFEERGFLIKVLNMGNMFQAYMPDSLDGNDGLKIHGNETFRHNGTKENKSVDLTLFRWTGTSGILLGKDEKKIRFRIDASDNVKNKRVDEIIERYNRNK